MREVALKRIKRRFSKDENLAKRFVVEAQLTGGLEHPGIVPVYGLGQLDDGSPYYAMRFVHGQSLRQAIEQFYKQTRNKRLRHESIEFRKLLQRFVSVCYTVHFAHSRGVLHRDIKPDNIMLGEYDETLVVDWGIAKVIGRKDPDSLDQGQTIDRNPHSTLNETGKGRTVGTPGYMSNEQAMGWHDVLTARSDVFSLGATMYYILTGTRLSRESRSMKF